MCIALLPSTLVVSPNFLIHYFFSSQQSFTRRDCPEMFDSLFVDLPGSPARSQVGFTSSRIDVTKTSKEADMETSAGALVLCTLSSMAHTVFSDAFSVMGISFKSRLSKERIIYFVVDIYLTGDNKDLTLARYPPFCCLLSRKSLSMRLHA